MPKPAEEWRPVPGYEGRYEVSDVGRMRRLAQRSRDGRRWPEKVLKVRPAKSGYVLVNIDRKPRRVHRFVCRAFNGPPPFPGALVRHLNGVPSDNRSCNLAWGSFADNARDCVRHGNHPHSSKNRCPRGHPLTDWNNCLKDGGRSCLACSRARAWGRYYGRTIEDARVIEYANVQFERLRDAARHGHP